MLDQYDRLIPMGTEHIWEWFWQLNRGRTCGMGMNPITWPEIDAWANRTGNNPKQWELDAITGIDMAFITINTPAPKPSKGKKP